MISFKQFIFFLKYLHMFLTRGILNAMQASFFSADVGGVSGAQDDGKRVTQFGLSANTL
jgi:hypothetical protein